MAIALHYGVHALCTFVGCKTVRIFAYSRLARFALKPLTPRLTDFFTDFEKKNPTVLQSSTFGQTWSGANMYPYPEGGTVYLMVSGTIKMTANEFSQNERAEMNVNRSP